jgi:hypothetical protein
MDALDTIHDLALVALDEIPANVDFNLRYVSDKEEPGFWCLRVGNKTDGFSGSGDTPNGAIADLLHTLTERLRVLMDIARRQAAKPAK